MNPLRWIRWKVLAVIVVVGGALYFLGLNPLARWQVNSVGTDNPAARWKVAEVGLGLLTGDFEFAELLIASAPKAAAEAAPPPGVDEKQKVFNAAGAELDVNMNEFLRRRVVVEEVRLTTPRVDVRRRPDGSTNVGDLGGEDEESAPTEPGDEKTVDDWIESARDWYEKLQKVREKLPQIGREDEGDRDDLDYYDRRVRYPFAQRPGMVVKRIVADGLVIDLSEQESDGAGDAAATARKLTTIESASASITGLSSRPDLHDQPMALDLEGQMAGAALKLDIDVDFRSDVPSYGVDLTTGKLPVDVINALVGDSLPVKLESGFIALATKVGLDGEEKIDLAPKLSFQGVRLATKDGEDTVAGVNALEFVNAFNEASKLLGDTPLDIADLTIDGTLTSPQFHWGDTVQNLVVQGGKAFANAQLAKAEALVRDEAAKLQADVTEKVGSEIDKAIGDSDAADAVKGAIDSLLPGTKKDAKDGDEKKDGDTGDGKGVIEDAAESGLDALRKGASGLFGGDKKDGR